MNVEQSVPSIAGHDVMRVELEHAREVCVRVVNQPGLEVRHPAAEPCVDVLGSVLEDLGEVSDCEIPQL